MSDYLKGWQRGFAQAKKDSLQAPEAFKLRGKFYEFVETDAFVAGYEMAYELLDGANYRTWSGK